MLYFFGGFLFEEMTTTIALIIPMFSIYTTSIIKYIIANKNKIETELKLINKAYAFIAFAIPLIFVLLILSIVFMKVFNIGFSSFEQFKTMLAISETAFGAYIGLVLTSLFEISQSKELSSKS